MTELSFVIEGKMELQQKKSKKMRFLVFPQPWNNRKTCSNKSVFDQKTFWPRETKVAKKRRQNSWKKIKNKPYLINWCFLADLSIWIYLLFRKKEKISQLFE